MLKQKVKLTPVSVLHYIRLCYRSALFLLLAISYTRYHMNLSKGLIDQLEERPAILVFTCVLFTVEMALLIRWEITIYLHPERFAENTNEYLRCRNCTEKLCTHKKQLNTLWEQIEAYTSERLKRLKK